MNQNERIYRSMHNAKASIKMEEWSISEDIKKLCQRILNKEMAFEEHMNWINRRLAQNGLQH